MGTGSCRLGYEEQDREASCIAAVEQELQGLQEERAKAAKLRAQLEQAATRMQQEQRAWAKRKVWPCQHSWILEELLKQSVTKVPVEPSVDKHALEFCCTQGAYVCWAGGTRSVNGLCACWPGASLCKLQYHITKVGFVLTSP